MAKKKQQSNGGLELLKPSPDNPRVVGVRELDGLTESLKRFGDISGIVWNKRSGSLVAGHQRVRVLTERFGEAAVFDEAAGTLTVGKQVYPVRVVDWDEETARAAMIAANSPYLSGAWDWKHLGTLLEQLPELADLRFDALRAEAAIVLDESPAPADLKPDSDTAAADKPAVHSFKLIFKTAEQLAEFLEYIAGYVQGGDDPIEVLLGLMRDGEEGVVVSHEDD